MYSTLYVHTNYSSVLVCYQNIRFAYFCRYYNGAGFHVSKSFGFGVLDCAAMAQMALGWPGTPSQSRCTLSKTNLNKYTISSV